MQVLFCMYTRYGTKECKSHCVQLHYGLGNIVPCMMHKVDSYVLPGYFPVSACIKHLDQK